MAEPLKWSLPVKGGTVTARFGESGPRWTNKHTGIDYAAPRMTGVLAAADGKIKKSGWYNDRYGNVVIIDHGGGIESWYAHLEAVIATGSADHPRGSLIAFVGDSGNATGPHLHFEIRVNGTPVDPEPYLKGTAPPLLPGLPGPGGEIPSDLGIGAMLGKAGYFIGGVLAIAAGLYLFLKGRNVL
jgi:murein DD-endopeptidase MepM/ murein hydrolase activator NlpD